MLISVISSFMIMAVELPMGPAPKPVAAPHFPDRLHAYVWRNWPLVPTERLAEAVGAKPENIVRMGEAMGLPAPPKISEDQFRRSSTTIIKHNWQLLPYDQLLKLLGWTADEMAYYLREDDFLFIKLGSLKPQCEPLIYAPPDAKTLEREKAIAATIQQAFPEGLKNPIDPPFGFVARLSKAPAEPPSAPSRSGFSPRYCFSYFGLTGDPFLGNTDAIYPDGYLAQLAATGVDGVWLQGVLYTLAPFPWDAKVSARYEERLENLRQLVAHAKKYGIGVYLYLNEPRAMPLAFFKDHAELKGVTEGDYAALCTSHPEVQAYIRDSVASICRAVPGLRGFFSITASENFTNCYSHFQGKQCSRCGKRAPQEVIAELNTLYRDGIRQAGSKADLIVWDWGWPDDWHEPVIKALPTDVGLMSVSEWSIPIERGGVKSVTGEYSMSVIGPGPRAQRAWQLARDHGMKTLAKVQVGTTWEIGSVPYIPVVDNVARHMANLRDAHVDGLMLSWTLGGYPSPGLEVAAEMGRASDGGTPPTTEEAMKRVAVRRFGPNLAPLVVDAWRALSKVFQEYPYGMSLYTAPVHVGPSNPLWEKPTGYAGTMVGFPYDDLKGWVGVYPVDVFTGQFMKVADGFDEAIAALRQAAAKVDCTPAQRQALNEELDVADACAIHFRSAANQARFVKARDALAKTSAPGDARAALDSLEQATKDEMALALRLHAIQSRDSRIGYEASNQYYYLPVDLAEKVLNCRDLLDRWIPAERAKRAAP